MKRVATGQKQDDDYFSFLEPLYVILAERYGWLPEQVNGLTVYAAFVYAGARHPPRKFKVNQNAKPINAEALARLKAAMGAR